MRLIIRIIAAAAVFFGLPACGQKGPLFIAPQSVPYKLLPNSSAASLPATPASAAK